MWHILQEIEDHNIRETDNLLLVGVMEDDYCRLEVNVFENDDERNTYVSRTLSLSRGAFRQRLPKATLH